ncbi:glycosyltransferase family protein, partial [Corynebacterium casei]|uniref:glycosyltransferase family protein n=1 Tax=Corynebacterium casei TaxID=160386 RepID=UPI003FCF5FF7
EQEASRSSSFVSNISSISNFTSTNIEIVIIMKRTRGIPVFSSFRTSLWHLRKGGIIQLGRHLEYTEKQRLIDSEAEIDKAKVKAIRLEKQRGFDALEFPEFVPNRVRTNPFGHYKVGAILDTESQLAWGSEFSIISLTPDGWKTEVEDVDFLLVESAWQGNHGVWRDHIGGNKAPSLQVQELVKWCNGRNIPTVFWSTVDNDFFDDFISTASLFDFIGTTDSESVDRYRRQPGLVGEVFVLQFAAQPSIHNPMRDQVSGRRNIGSVCFTGIDRYELSPEVQCRMESFLQEGIDACENLNSALTIYSDGLNIPSAFRDWIVKPLPYTSMLSAYRGYKVFLNGSSVENNPILFPRETLELLASGTPVVSTPNTALRSLFGDIEVIFAQNVGDAAAAIESLVRSPIARDRIVHRAQQEIWANHTYSHRAVEILRRIGLDSSNSVTEKPFVSVVMATFRPVNLEFALSQIGNQRGVDIEILVGTHGFPGDPGTYPGIRFIEFPMSMSLGECLNRLIDEANGQYVAKMDDDDLYGPDYLRDQVNGLRFSGATVVGKQASYLYLEDSEELILRKPWREHLWTEMVLGATLVAESQVFRDTRFPEANRGEDTSFLKQVIQKGGRIYSTDRFNYIQVRNTGSHTWQVTNIELKRSGQVETFGLNTKHVFVGKGQ